ncbi:hypothetical protein N476_15400 [Pseudoalteromonas luteoviolacea H33]|uniref:Uncharacterized protein n=1 Tax=Pseudoalteromonas luteoviolacea H33 TaxID=1365251 RepID=A0A167EF76_9GAMM|nr:hypothetical protein N476_15400 [Pseudoalteromonas luteoviolacea H33]KZN77617.1 hypothetical protein N477_11645 [Pseudoalteromonas luteoviolacea H33-S]
MEPNRLKPQPKKSEEYLKGALKMLMRVQGYSKQKDK